MPFEGQQVKIDGKIYDSFSKACRELVGIDPKKDKRRRTARKILDDHRIEYEEMIQGPRKDAMDEKVQQNFPQKDQSGEKENGEENQQKNQSSGQEEEGGEGEEVIQFNKQQLQDFVDKIRSGLKEELREDLQGKNKESSQIDQLVEKLKEGNINEQLGDHVERPLSSEAIDYSDVLDEPVTFFNYSMGFAIHGDKRYGHPVKTPFGRPIKFEHGFRSEKPGTGRHYKEFITVSFAKINSKKELEWLRNHSLYGIKFFEDIRKAKNVSPEEQDVRVECANEVNAMTEHEMVSRCKMEGLELSPDMNDMKKRLVHHLADQRLQGKYKHQEQMAEEMKKTEDRVKA